MNSHLAPLIELQGLDLRIVEIKERRRKIPELLETAERPLRDAKHRIQEASATADKAAKTRREREQDLEAQEAQIKKLKDRVSEIKKNVEYQAHLFEIQIAGKKKGEIEEQILLLMEEVEEGQRLVKEATGQVAEAEGLFAGKRTELEALDSKLAAELDILESKQREVAKSLDKTVLDRYKKLKSSRKDLAVAPVREGICSGCRLQLAPQLVAEVRRAQELLTCSFCQRILYWEGDPPLTTGDPTEPPHRPAANLPETG